MLGSLNFNPDESYVPSFATYKDDVREGKTRNIPASYSGVIFNYTAVTYHCLTAPLRRDIIASIISHTYVLCVP